MKVDIPANPVKYIHTMNPIRHASQAEVLEAHSRSISIFGGVFLRLSKSEQQDHYQHMRDEQSHPEDDDIGYDD